MESVVTDFHFFGAINGEAVLSAAKEATGLSDFGPRSFHEALQVLLDDYASDTGLSGVGRPQIQFQ